ncbi:EF-P 5-aminopentanol modification-associated protein YfmH [Mammaliicoccus stepanovicii]|uniref:Peptidase, M16 family n=1 Tax=Mammaliicoccus stepanovicii TaxID=643214 RepID=A0A239ZHG6_9STAP|nr:pitrilysin family protein [Mammaliicoccus stepanovicii]PNZ79031.1 peptidase M16 [Mammaliicoccus stepanovicii]GGI41858.1 peptidase M16 [Mammaliicoccus stepanovicii]SNV70154.1 peptidase, M16 family [Mammaliicoccus stepanovicii]
MNSNYYKQIDETVFEETLNNGLKIVVIPKKGFYKTFVTYTTQFGSLDNTFKPHGQDEFVTVPDGVAHFLEHKLFEKEEGDIFTSFAEHDAQVNAFTTFDRTSYLFSATDKVNDNILRLLKMIESPYFTEKTVEKEKGIIAEEIKMYKEQPNYKLMFQTLAALYHHHPVQIDIAGSVESIYKITADDLYLSYETFYHPANMVVIVVGDVDPEETIQLIRNHEDKREMEEMPPITRKRVDEPESVCQHYVETKMDIVQEKTMIAFKFKPNTISDDVRVKKDIEMMIALDLIFGEQTEFYQTLLEKGVLDDTFGYQFANEMTYSYLLFAVTTDEHQTFVDAIKSELSKFIKEGFDEADLHRVRKQTLGEMISSLNSPEYIANQYTKFYFEGVELFNIINILETITVESVRETLESLINFDHVVESRLVRLND